MTDILFHEVPDAQVILRSKGVYRQAKVFRRGSDIYAAWGSGFIRLLSSSGTTVPTVVWDALDALHPVVVDRGRPAGLEGRKLMMSYLGFRLVWTGVCVVVAGKLVGLCLPGDMNARRAEFIEQGIKVAGAVVALAGVLIAVWTYA